MAERDLAVLIRSMQPQLQEGVFVFCSLAKGSEVPSGIAPICVFQELEGTTLILREEEVREAVLSYQFPSRQITLNVRSALDAVGFLAAITAELAKVGISVNAVSAFYHDHLFVPVDRADEAMRVLHGASVAAGI